MRLLLIFLIMTLLITGCELVDGISSSISPREVHDLINIERERNNRPPVSWSNRMERLAQGHSDEMAEQDRMFHSNRYALEGGENVWSGTGHSWSASDVVQSWMNSPGHREWLLDRRVKSAGVGVSQSSSGTYAAWAFEGR